MSTINKTWKEIYDLIFELGINQELKKFIELEKEHPPALEDIWVAMDRVWDNIGCNNLNFNCDKINQFYSHPIWLFNGLWIETDELSMQHRHAISDYIVKQGFRKVIDYGGGYATLARLIVNKEPSICVDIFEPYPTQYALEVTKSFTGINFIDEIDGKYDCLVSTDVLEHVEDPLSIFKKMIDSVQLNGYLLIANNFYPVIKCHLPTTFHLRFTFNKFAAIMGLDVIGRCEESHATVYKKISENKINWHKIRVFEQLSKLSFPLLRITQFAYHKVKKIL